MRVAGMGRRYGFTLIELLVVIAIIALLMGILDIWGHHTYFLLHFSVYERQPPVFFLTPR